MAYKDGCSNKQISKAICKIVEKGAGIHRLHKNRYVFGEQWDYECVPSKHQEEPYDYINHVEKFVIPNELKRKGFSIVCMTHTDLKDDNVPYGWTIAVLKKK